MGVQGLWKILEQTADPVKLETLRGKTLAIDASIWIYHFLKAMRDPKGTVLVAAHVIGFFRRICKLMFFEIKPVFVFDGAAPLLKKQTTHRRSERRVGREQTARSTANKLLTIQLQRAAKQGETFTGSKSTKPNQKTEIAGSVPQNAVYFDDLVSNTHQPTSPRASAGLPAPAAQFVATDQYHLPEMDRIGPIRTDDQRLLTEEELEEYGKQFTSQARAGFIDTSLVDFKSKEFELLPVETQYQLLNMARMKSRLRMGYTTEQLNEMFPNEMEFSKFQINRVAQRNFFTQKLINLMGMEEDLTRRVSSEKNKEYMLKKNDQGWSLSLGDDQEDQKMSVKQPLLDIVEHKSSVIPRYARTQPEASSESELEFEEVDLSTQDNNISAPDPVVQDSKQSSSAHTHQLNDTEAEAPPTVDQLFGFEARLSRDSLYDRLAFNMDSEDEEESLQTGSEAPRAAKFSSGGGARSMLFGKSAKDRFESPGTGSGKQGATNETRARPSRLSNEPSTIDSTHGASRSPATVAVDEKTMNARAKPKAPTVPWFEEQGNFEDMQIQEREQDNFVPLDYESDSEPVIDQPVATSDRTNSIGTNILQDHPVDLTEPPQPSREEELETERSLDITDTPPVSDSQTPSLQNKRSSVPPQSDSSSTAPDHIAGDYSHQEPQEFDVASSHSSKDVPKQNTHPPSSESDGSIVELSAEDAARAEEDAKAKEEEEEDIAGMLIAEAEENERFAKELANQTNQNWSQANERDYETQISQLRGQFAKASRDADNVTSEMIQECQELLQLFGIPYITAPGEAEAQCATLHSLKLVDGVVTDDGDTFLFDDNARVYRNMFSQAKFVEFYSTKRIHSRLGLDRRSMIDLAFLLGSDYTDGILGIGPVTGVEILAEFGSLHSFAKWWSEAQRFPDQAEVDTALKRRLLKNFQTKLYLSDDFPDPVVVHAYTHPAVDKNSEKFSWGTPDLDGLRRFMETTAGWDADKTDATLLPVVQESRRRELLDKTEKVMNQSRLEDYYQSVVQNPALGSKRAARAAGLMRKRQKK